MRLRGAVRHNKVKGKIECLLKMQICCLCDLGVVKGWRKMQKDFLVSPL
jgi:hypothetical protein